MSLLELGPVIFGPTDDLIAWFRAKRLLARSQDCSACNLPMRQGTRNDVTDGLVWRCSRCKTTKSIRAGSFFSKSRLPLQKWLLLLHFWVREYPVTDAATDIEVDKNTACDVYRWFREVCSTTLLGLPCILGGPGVIVQVDESLYRHKPKVIIISHIHVYESFTFVPQYHHGRSTSTEMWVFGMCDTSHSPARGYMELVPDRRAATLLPIIQSHVAPGTIIHSDQGSMYNRVSSLPGVASHGTVNHSIEFVNSTTGVHTQNIESYWNRSNSGVQSLLILTVHPDHTCNHYI